MEERQDWTWGLRWGHELTEGGPAWRDICLCLPEAAEGGSRRVHSPPGQPKSSLQGEPTSSPWGPPDMPVISCFPSSHVLRAPGTACVARSLTGGSEEHSAPWHGICSMQFTCPRCMRRSLVGVPIPGSLTVHLQFPTLVAVVNRPPSRAGPATVSVRGQTVCVSHSLGCRSCGQYARDGMPIKLYL